MPIKTTLPLGRFGGYKAFVDAQLTPIREHVVRGEHVFVVVN
jgi:hypothetical protein